MAAPDDFAALVERLADERFAVERLAAGLRALEARLAAAVEDLARDPVERLAEERFAVARLAVERFAVERLAVGLRAPLRGEADDDVARAAEPSSPDHLPDITRCAASATASAISEPNLVALAIMLVAA